MSAKDEWDGPTWIVPVLLFSSLAALQWFVFNVGLALDSSAHIPDSDKIVWGLRSALMPTHLGAEGWVLVSMAMAIVPAMVGVEYATCAMVRRRLRKMGHFPHRRLLNGNWVWFLHWPLWLGSLLVVNSMPAIFGGLFVIPPVIAVVIGIWAGRS